MHKRYFTLMFVYTDIIVVITPFNQSTGTQGHTVSCSVEDNTTAVDNYTWVDSATGNVVHYGTEWIVKPCQRNPCVDVDDADINMADNCVNVNDSGLMMLECHVTVGITTVREAVVLYLRQSETGCDIPSSG